MQCDQCGDTEAVIHLTTIENNELSTLHLCEACAAEKGLEPGATGTNLPLADFLAQMGKSGGGGGGAPAECGFCGMSLGLFKKTGRLGCPQCYVSFEGHLKNLLRRLHGGTQHLGKVYLPPDPSEAALAERLAGLRRRLNRAVESEDFERAAQIRDEIRGMETTA